MPSAWLNALIVAAIACLGYGLALYMDRSGPPPAPSPVIQGDAVKEIPAFAFTDIKGQRHQPDAFRGKVIIVNFWATWCAPCVTEFPQLIRLAESRPKDVILIALSSDIEKEPVERFLAGMEKKGIKARRDNIFIGLEEKDEISGKLFGTYRLPETFIFGRDGVLREKLVGADWDFPKIQDLVTELASEPQSRQ